MSQFRVQGSAEHRLDEIYSYTRDNWGEVQAERYIRGLFERFTAIAERRVPRRPVPAAFGVDGYVCRYDVSAVWACEPSAFSERLPFEVLHAVLLIGCDLSRRR